MVVQWVPDHFLAEQMSLTLSSLHPLALRFLRHFLVRGWRVDSTQMSPNKFLGTTEWNWENFGKQGDTPWHPLHLSMRKKNKHAATLLERWSGQCTCCKKFTPWSQFSHKALHSPTQPLTSPHSPHTASHILFSWIVVGTHAAIHAATLLEW